MKGLTVGTGSTAGVVGLDVVDAHADHTVNVITLSTIREASAYPAPTRIFDLLSHLQLLTIVTHTQRGSGLGGSRLGGRGLGGRGDGGGWC